jgi:hypothetical protein
MGELPSIEDCLDEMFLPVNMLDQLGAWEDEIRALVTRARSGERQSPTEDME